ncbi:MAG: tetratricopeptide repeat protein [Planctomycetes bacterium]|nr:tetratricopeptide repeat protein [Planctomycetota bacterium]
MGASDPRTRQARNNLAAALQLKRATRERPPRPGTRSSRFLSRRRPGGRSRPSRPCSGSLASALLDLGRVDLAEARAREAVALFDGRETPTDPARLTALMALASVLETRGAYDEAEDLLRQVLAARTKSDGADAVTTLSATSALGLLLLHAQRFDEAHALLAAAVEGARRELSDGHWYTASLRGDLGTCLIGEGRFDEARRRTPRRARGPASRPRHGRPAHARRGAQPRLRLRLDRTRIRGRRPASARRGAVTGGDVRRRS